MQAISGAMYGQVQMALERIQKVLAAAGLGSRRDCEQMVADGRVRVNGELIERLPLIIDPDHDRVTVDGRPIRRARLVYFVLHKPAGVQCTMSRVEGRTTVGGLMARLDEPVMPVGRMDAECAGLVLLTNDRDMMAALSDPRCGLEKTYRVETASPPDAGALASLREGIRLSDGRTAPARVKVIHSDRQRCVFEVSINDRLQREVPRILARHGLKVKRITRIKFGKLSLREIPVAAARPLTREELAYLRKAASGEMADAPAAMPRRASANRSAPTRRMIGRKSTREMPQVGPNQHAENRQSPKTAARAAGPVRRRRIILPDE
ncbi:MAG: rRNA pseudouridine synthase [Phycisphaerae bacterium]|nr:rRNA pseudouridine synthase [Phycisphaerae bacterium]